MSYDIKRRSLFRFGIAAGLGSAIGQAAAFDLDDPLILRAREEAKRGKFRIMVSSPKQESGHELIMAAFHQRVQFETDWEWLPLTSPVSGPRVVELAKTGAELPSAIGGYGYNTYEPTIGRNDLAMAVDWVAEYGHLFPSVRLATEGIPQRYSATVLRQWDVIYTWAFNTSMMSRESLPANIEELGDRKWRSSYVISNVNSSPLEIWGLQYDEKYVIATLDALLSNRPRFKAGPPAAVGAVAAGEVPIALCGYTALAEAMRQKGAPIDWSPIGGQVFVQPLFVFMLKDAPLPNLGKLFLAWLCSEGRELQEEAESLSMWGDRKSATMSRLLEVDADVRAVSVGDDEMLDRMLELDHRLMERIAGVTGKAHT